MVLQQFGKQVHYSAFNELLDIEAGLTGYNLDIVRNLAKGLHFNKDLWLSYSILEFGAGSGTLAEIWKSELGIVPVCVEIDPKLIQILRAKDFDTYSDIHDTPNQPNVIYTSNVLEHIKDDVGTLSSLKSVMSPGGLLGIYVPALPFLFSDLDRTFGHWRRYKRRELIQKVEMAGFKINSCFYNDSIGVLASLVIRVFGFSNRFGLGSSKSLVFYDKFIYPISRILDKVLFKRIIGKNLFLFAENSENLS